MSSPAKRLYNTAVVVWLALVGLTVVTIWLVYDHYAFSRWHWFRVSCILATLTCLWTFALWFTRRVYREDETNNPVFYGLVIIPFNFLLVYPGAEALGLHSDEDGIWLLLILEFVHGSGFYIIQREIRRYLRSLDAV